MQCIQFIEESRSNHVTIVDDHDQNISKMHGTLTLCIPETEVLAVAISIWA